MVVAHRIRLEIGGRPGVVTVDSLLGLLPQVVAAATLAGAILFAVSSLHEKYDVNE